MRTIEAKFQDWEPANKRHAAPLLEADADGNIILRDADTGAFLAAQVLLDGEQAQRSNRISRMLRYDVQWAFNNARLSGISSANHVFGTLEPNKLRRRFGCQYAALNYSQPQLKHELDEIGAYSFQLFSELAPQEAEAHQRLVDEHIAPDWQTPGAPFTSGVINHSAALPYHKDSGNLLGAWSTMLAIRKDIDGGHLHLPEYGVTLEIPNNSISIFSGQSLWHGVTPLIQRKKTGYRFTLVWYVKRGICNCLPATQEVARAALEAMESAKRTS
jgi:hypothetical protein